MDQDPSEPLEADTDVLRRFLHNRDAPCPRCGYNLRNLEGARCPECGDELVLRVNLSGNTSPVCNAFQ